MTFWWKSLNTPGILLVLVMAAVFAAAPASHAQIPNIVVNVGDTVAPPAYQNTVITITLTNLVDTIAGFNIYLQLDNPDLIRFQQNEVTVYDTTFWDCIQFSGPTCTDSVQVLEEGTWDFFHVDTLLDTIGNFDTTGTLCSGWDLVAANSLNGIGTDLVVAGIADLPGGTAKTGVLPGVQDQVLIKVLADVFDVEDSLTDRTVNILVQTDFKDYFGFSRPNGTSITWVQQEVTDTNCYVCTQWVGETCFNYQQVGIWSDPSDCDSLAIFLDTITVLDSAHISIFDGSVTILPGGICGNVDGSNPPAIDIADLLYLVDYMFGNPAGPAPDPLLTADLNCDLAVDIADLLAMVDYQFGNPSIPICVGC